MKKLTTILVVVLLACNALAVLLDDHFDDGVVDPSLWAITGAAGEVWESGTTLEHNDADSASPRPSVRSRADNGYAWTSGIAQIWWDTGGRYTGLMTQPGGGDFLLVRKDVTGGYWSLSAGGTNYTVYDFYLQTDNWYWEIDFDNSTGAVDFRGKMYSSSAWDIERSYTYSSSDPFSLETASYNTSGSWDRMAFVPEPTTIALLGLGLLALRKKK